MAREHNQARIYLNEYISFPAYRMFESQAKGFAIFKLNAHHSAPEVLYPSSPYQTEIGEQVQLGGNQPVYIIEELTRYNEYRSACYLVSGHSSLIESGLPVLNKNGEIIGATVNVSNSGLQPQEMQITLSNILFETARAALRPAGETTLDHLVLMLNRLDEYILEIEGHTDNQGYPTYDNQSLSENRANSVASYLIGKGIPAEWISTSGKSLWEPIASNETDAGRQLNRRVEILVKTDNPDQLATSQLLIIPIAEILNVLPEDMGTQVTDGPRAIPRPETDLEFKQRYQLREQIESGLGNPEVIEYDRHENLYILDTRYNRLSKWDKDGYFVKSIPGIGESATVFKQPIHFTITPHNLIVLIDKELEQIILLNSELQLIERIPFNQLYNSTQVSTHQLRDPVLQLHDSQLFAPLAVGALEQGLVFLNADRDLYFFDNHYRYSHTLERKKFDRYQFDSPEQLEAMDPYVYVYNSHQKAITRYHKDGTQVDMAQLDLDGPMILGKQGGDPVLADLNDHQIITLPNCCQTIIYQEFPIFSPRGSVQDISIVPNSYVALAYREDPSIQIYDMQGQFITSITTYGEGMLATDMFSIEAIQRIDDTLVVLDNKNNFHRFDGTGKVESERIATNHPSKNHITSFFINDQHQYLLTDGIASQILQWDSESNLFEPKVQDTGTLPGQLENPKKILGMKTDRFPAQTYWVLDHQQDRILVFDGNWIFLGEISASKAGGQVSDFTLAEDNLYILTEAGIVVFTIEEIAPLQLHQQTTVIPEGCNSINDFTHLALLDSEILVLTDAIHHRLWLGNKNGQIYRWFGSFGYGESAFNQPGPLYVDGTTLYVADRGNFSVLQFELSKNDYLSLNPHQVHPIFWTE